jgi:hypothetical protein
MAEYDANDNRKQHLKIQDFVERLLHGVILTYPDSYRVYGIQSAGTRSTLNSLTDWLPYIVLWLASSPA